MTLRVLKPVCEAPVEIRPQWGSARALRAQGVQAARGLCSVGRSAGRAFPAVSLKWSDTEGPVSLCVKGFHQSWAFADLLFLLAVGCVCVMSWGRSR